MRETWRAAVAAFTVSRALVFVLIVFVSQMAFEGKDASFGAWNTRVVLKAPRFVPELMRMMLIADATWYQAIADVGYERRAFDTSRQTTWAFFPLYPLTVRYVRVTPHYSLNGMVVSHLAFLGALLLLGAVARGGGMSVEDSQRAIWCAALFPTSYFFSLPLPEAFFLLLSLAAWRAAQTETWWAMGVLGGLAALARPGGILLVIPLTLLAWRKARGQVAWVALVPLGTATFMLFLDRITGNPFAFRDIQTAWYRTPAPFWAAFGRYTANPAMLSDPWNFLVLNFVMAVAVLLAALMFLARREWALGLYTLAAILMPLSTGSLQSVSRYAVVIFPIFLLLAMAGRRPNAERVILATSALLLGWFVALFALRVDLALA
ncbi:MAG TPA: hypothetical protein VF698_09975 [Thermoanaerobaculia bacterium]|jgi:hypothetical protein